MNTKSRREFLVNLARAGAFSGLSFLGVSLLSRGPKVFTCTPSDWCQHCRLADSCDIRIQAAEKTGTDSLFGRLKSVSVPAFSRVRTEEKSHE